VTKPIPEEIREYIDYNPETGECVWKRVLPMSNHTKAGDEAGSLDKVHGYYQLRFSGKLYRLHRVVWYLHYGEQPGDKHIDHINGNRSDNRISNLRLVTQQENNHNTAALGITYYARTGKWMSQIKVDNESKYLGYFDCPLMAGLAYKDAKRQLHPTAVRGL
jgi:hypothetical protein